MGLNRVAPSFTGFFLDSIKLTGFSLGSTELYLYWVLLGGYLIVPSFTEFFCFFFEILPNDLPIGRSFTFYRVLLGFPIGFVFFFPRFTELYWVFFLNFPPNLPRAAIFLPPPLSPL